MPAHGSRDNTDLQCDLYGSNCNTAGGFASSAHTARCPTRGITEVLAASSPSQALDQDDAMGPGADVPRMNLILQHHAPRWRQIQFERAQGHKVTCSTETYQLRRSMSQ